MVILGLILARKGSERLPGKNRMSLGGVNLVDFAIDSMNETTDITRHAISTDDEMLGLYCEKHGIQWIRRPSELCTGTSDISSAIKHAQEHFNADYVVSFQCAVPLRPAGSTGALISEVLKEDSRGGLSVTRRSPWMWNVCGDTADKWWTKDQYPRSQDIEFTTYEEINSVQVTHKSVIGSRWGYPMSFVELPGWAAFDIDDKADLDYCQKVWQHIKGEYYTPREYHTFTIKGE